MKKESLLLVIIVILIIGMIFMIIRFAELSANHERVVVQNNCINNCNKNFDNCLYSLGNRNANTFPFDKYPVLEFINNCGAQKDNCSGICRTIQ